MRGPSRTRTAAFKSKAGLEALKCDKKLAELAWKYDVHGNPITQRKAQLMDGAFGVLMSPAEKRGTEKGSHGVAISTDGRGCWRDNMFVEGCGARSNATRSTCTPTSALVQPKPGVGRYLEFYNGPRPRTALGDRSPDEGYFTRPTIKNAA